MLKQILFLLCFFSAGNTFCQQLTGIWKGRIGGQKAEVKFVLAGDSIRGTSYYTTLSGYRRYSISGYRDAYTNSITWWDDQLLEEKGNGIGSAGKVPLASVADFNCPGGGVMMLDGKASPKGDGDKEGDVHLDKTTSTRYPDEWDFVIENYLSGANHPFIIDSVAQIALRGKQPVPTPQPAVVIAEPQPMPEQPIAAVTPPPAPTTIEQKFVTRQSKHVLDIPLSGDSIELRFYDNAEIDGDSIALFLNKELIFQHVRLAATPHVVRIAVSSLQGENELVMVAENLGKIPPNTSYMVAICGGQRYEANLQSTEATSALIRLIKPED